MKRGWCDRPPGLSPADVRGAGAESRFAALTLAQDTRQEIADLFAVADRDLKVSQTHSLHNDWRFNISYDAALQLATAALSAAGFRAERANHHYRVIESLGLTIGADAATIKKFDIFCKKRNISDYERAGGISDFEAAKCTNSQNGLGLRRGLDSRKPHPVRFIGDG